MSITIRVPGKLILAGEHAVVHGAPALAVALDSDTSVTLTPHAEPHDTLTFVLDDLDSHISLTFPQLQQLRQQLLQRYRDFSVGRIPITEVLTAPEQLAQLAAATFLADCPQPTQHGLTLTISSALPIGSGLGSSAAIIVGILSAMNAHFETRLSDSALLSLAQSVENLQHGRSSGLDLSIAYRGGCQRWQSGKHSAHPMPPTSLQCIDTGRPLSSSGECVSTTRTQFDGNPERLTAFTQAVNAMSQALTQQDERELIHALREQHRLLCAIGVVPQRIQAFVAEIEARGGGAKICGAGATRGDAAGIMLALCPDPIDSLIQQYGFKQLQVNTTSHGQRKVSR